MHINCQVSLYKIPYKLSPMHSILQGDICGFITRMSESFRYVLFLVDASSKEFHVYLFSSNNLAFVNLLSMLLRFEAHFHHYPIQTLRVNIIQEFGQGHLKIIAMQLKLTS